MDKTALKEKHVEIKSKLDNFLDFGYFSNVPIDLLWQLILIITISLISNIVIYYTPNIISFNSDSKIIYSQIYLLLSLNQIKQLIIEEILEYIVKNKEKMYFNLN